MCQWDSDLNIKQLINNHYNCDKCLNKDKCVYGEGYDLAFDVNYCTADGFAAGVKTALTKLKHMPCNKAMDCIVNNNF